MALRTYQTRDENSTRLAVAGKNYYGKPDLKPRAALGSLNITNQTQKSTFHKDAKKPVVKPPIHVKVRDAGRAVHQNPAPRKVKEKTPEVEHMEMEDVDEVAAKLSSQLYIEDIDVVDRSNPQLCAEYVKDIYEYMMRLEKKYHVSPTYMTSQPRINSRMRAILIDWLIQVHLRFTLLQETLYLTVSILDRYLAAERVEKEHLQLVGVTAMWIASKYEEMYAPEVRDFVFITEDTYSCEEIRKMERKMLRVLDYSFGNPLCLHFLRRYSRAGEATPKEHTLSKFLIELCLVDYPMLEFTPSQKAASALYISKMVIGAGSWTPTLEHYTTYRECDILPCACKMAKLVQNMVTAKQQAVRTKYSSSKFMEVSKLDRLFSQEMKTLAAS